MKILIIGSGGREFAIALKLKEYNHELFFAPGNGATSHLGSNLNIKNFNDLADFVKENSVDLTIVGPETPLSEGIVDIFRARNLTIFGPSKAAARLESSKAYMKDFLAKNCIRTAKFISTNNVNEAQKFIQTLKLPIVVKADGLCAGKGVIIAKSKDEAIKAVKDMLDGSFADAGKRVVIEEYLDGFELSFFAICDGENFVTLPVAQDHKRLLDNDMGVNTGGMGAYAPSPLASQKLIKQIEEEIIKPTLNGMKNENSAFCGVLFVGLMIVNNLPYVLEFNVRFGDPECEVLMPLIDGDLGEILFCASRGNLKPIKLKDIFAVGVVMSSKNYPFSNSQKEKISVLDIPPNSHIAYAGVSEEGGEIYADGGRILVCVGLGKNIKDAQQNAYKLCKNVKFDGSYYRKDIAWQILKDKNESKDY